MSKKNPNTKLFYNSTIPVDWEVLEMKAVCQKITDGTHDTPTPVEQGIPFLTAIHVKENLIDFDNCYFLPESIHKEIYKRCNPQKGDVLMVNIGAGVATTALINIDYEFSLKNVALLKPNTEKVLGSYLNYYQVFIKPKLTQSLLNGGAQPFLSLKQIQKLKITLPSLPEQKAIAHILSLMDTAINKTNLLIAKKELQKKALMQNLLTGKKRLKGYGREWKEMKLSDVFERVTRKNTEGNTTVVTISAQRGFVRQTDFFTKLIASEITDNYFLVEKGEFCYNKSYSNGYPWGATKRLKDYEKAVVTTLYICFGIKDTKNNDGDFFEQFLEANLLDKGLTQIAHEGGRAHGLLNVTPSDFFSLKITIPSKEEQIAIAHVLQAADKEIQLLKAKTEKLREQKKGLMQVLLTGKKRLKTKKQYMKVIGIEIKSNEAILVVLEKDNNGNITQSTESIRIGIDDSSSNNQVRQFMLQVKASLDNINADAIGILARNGKAKGVMTPSPFSFKLEGLFQLYEKKEVQFFWPQTISAFLKKSPCNLVPQKKYQANAFNLACYLLNR